MAGGLSRQTPQLPSSREVVGVTPNTVIPREPFDLPASRAAQGESAGPIPRKGKIAEGGPNVVITPN